MSKTYWGPDGKPYPRPYGLEAAKKARNPRYYNPDPCPKCGKHLCYTRNSHCVMCARLDANDFYCYALNLMSFEYDEETGVTRTNYKATGRMNPETWNREVALEHRERVEDLFQSVPDSVPHTPSLAAQAGVDLYIHPEPCSESGHMHLRTLEGKCFLCEQERNTLTPRQEAIRHGESWYEPDTPCPICGLFAMRRVDNGRCRGCRPAPLKCSTEQTAEQLMMAAQPDLILSKSDAMALGVRVYRTGRPCRHGHTGYRYVSSGNCIDCFKERKTTA